MAEAGVGDAIQLEHLVGKHIGFMAFGCPLCTVPAFNNLSQNDAKTLAPSPLELAHARGLREGEARGAERLKKEREKRQRLGLRYRASVGRVRRLTAALRAARTEALDRCEVEKSRHFYMIGLDNIVTVIDEVLPDDD